MLYKLIRIVFLFNFVIAISIIIFRIEFIDIIVFIDLCMSIGS